MFVEFMPHINRKRELLLEDPGFIKGILELTYKLITNTQLVHFDQVQEWIGAHDVFPLNFKPKSKYWMTFLKNEKKGTELENGAETGVVVREEVSQHLKGLLIGVADFIKIKLSLYIGMSQKVRTTNLEEADLKNENPKNKILNNNLKSLSSVLGIRKKLNQIIILCYLICRNIGKMKGQEEDFYSKEIKEVFDTVENWRDCSLIEEEVKKWYNKLIVL